MATNTVTGNLVCSDGTNIPLKLDTVEGLPLTPRTQSQRRTSATSLLARQ